MKKFQPMKAATLTPEWMPELGYPLMVSPKLDGFRCVVPSDSDNTPHTSNLKPVRNKHIQATFRAASQDLGGLDGELIVGKPTGGSVINRTSRGVTAASGEPDFTFWVFDDFTHYDAGFEYRWKLAHDAAIDHPWVRIVPHAIVTSEEDMLNLEAKYLAAGYEGVMLRDPAAPYKYGRATEREGSLWKLKRFRDGEMLVTGLEEAELNENVAFKDELGRTKRSTAKAGRRGKGMVGTIHGVDVKTGLPMKCGPGKMTHAERELYWTFKERLLGQVITYQVFDYGAVDAARFALFKCIRPAADMTTP